ncbi:hypothetical protein D7Y46_04030 [Stenotrophomonas maltophilia]|nr:hypothetical protein C6Y55_10945 [Stenotrophomonas maltophilia]MBA0287832.1 hypothetical protein [Stenotrophomonas maltophilia]MBA0314530.1 hypothetical protein [Stenotrophomonas maltophilia]MBA0325951.1 hypothetical protein [Stenotrophomonas maltophilia]MBA0421114.1 hypothetical protein [Stenotrophomonas maltophilia]
MQIKHLAYSLIGDLPLPEEQRFDGSKCFRTFVWIGAGAGHGAGPGSDDTQLSIDAKLAFMIC